MIVQIDVVPDLKQSSRNVRNDWNQWRTEQSGPEALRSERTYSSMKVAEVQACKATSRARELIIAYECPDCGQFHIGHADRSQQLARMRRTLSLCKFCKVVPIPESKKQKAAKYNSVALYCSDACQSDASRDRRQNAKKL
jgi:predicted RNA-binding Zn-ribbon protein involved in translation (DUF1610 family)